MSDVLIGISKSTTGKIVSTAYAVNVIDKLNLKQLKELQDKLLSVSEYVSYLMERKKNK
jgi:hypothetical protein